MDQMKVVLKYFELLCAVQCFSLDSEDDNNYVIRKHFKIQKSSIYARYL